MSGIGQHAALYLSDQGGFLVFAGVRRPEDGEALQAKAADPQRIVPVILDVTKPVRMACALWSMLPDNPMMQTHTLASYVCTQDQISATLTIIQSCGVNLVGLVNNAGVTGKADPVRVITANDGR